MQITPATLDLEITTGVDLQPFSIVANGPDPDNPGSTAPVNLTGWEVFAQARRQVGLRGYVDLKPTISDPLTGTISFPGLSATATAKLQAGEMGWDVVFVNPAGARVGPYIAGKITITAIYTRP